MQINQFQLLGLRRFLPFFITQFLGAFNDNVFKNALMILVAYQVTHINGMSTSVLVTLIAGIFILPFFLFSATAGQLADKYEKSSFIRIIKFAEIIIMCFAALGLYFENIQFLIFIIFLLGIQAAFFGPVKYAILPECLYEQELIAGNGLVEAGTFLAILLGTIVGGLVIILHDGKYWLGSIIILFAFAGFKASLYIPKLEAKKDYLKINLNFIHETFKILHYSTKRFDLFVAIIGISWFWLVGSVFLAEFPVFTKDILFAEAHVVTYFIALFTVGISLGSLLCNRLLKGKIDTSFVPIGALGITLFSVDLYFASNAMQSLHISGLMSFHDFMHTLEGWRISFDLLLIAMSGGLYTVPLYAILQQRSEQAFRARVIASNNIMNALFMAGSALIVMVLLKLGLAVNTIFLLVAIANGFIIAFIAKLK